MITIGRGNRKGGVGSTMLCYQLAALIQRAGCSVAIAETSLLGSDQLWCRGRSIREGRILNCTMKSVGYIFVDDYSDLCFADRWVGYDYVLLDYTNSRDDIELALRYVKHWICPLGPNESRPTMMVFDIWCDMRRLGRVAADTFCAVMNMTPNAEDIEEEPERADFRFNGDRSLEILAREAPLMKVLKRRIKNNWHSTTPMTAGTFFHTRHQRQRQGVTTSKPFGENSCSNGNRKASRNYHRRISGSILR